MKIKKIFPLLLCIFAITITFFFAGCNKKEEFDLCFMIDNEVYKTISTCGNESISLPDEPTKSGYEFDGWYFDDGTWEKPFTTNTLSNTELLNNTNIYGKWKLVKYTAKFYADDELIGTSEFTVEDSMISDIPEVPDKIGYDGFWDTYTIQASDLIINAVYNLKTFTVIWKNYDNTILETETDIEYGTIPSYKGNTPQRESNAEFSYQFTGWSPSVTNITDNIEYVAQYIEIVNRYNVVWKNYNGDILEIETDIEYGTIPTYKGITPQRESDPEFSYQFTGWSPQISNIYGDIVYIAQFNQIKNKYTITWSNFDGTILKTEKIEYGIIPNYSGETPTKQSSAQYSYIFSGWSPQVCSVTENVTYIAQYNETINKYTVTFKNYDGSVLFTSTVNYGTSAIYDENTPERDDEEHYSYIFSGWDKDFSVVTFSFDVIAQYTQYTKYEFSYANGDTEIVRLKSGESITNYYPDNTQTTTIGLVKYYYEGWKSVSEYSYTENIRTVQLYTITYYLSEGINSENNVNILEDGSNFELSSPSKIGYEFIGWYTDSTYTNQISIITNISENIDLYALFELSNYTIVYHLDNGTNAIKNPDSFTCEDEITLKDATKEGYAFMGWFYDESFINQVTVIKNHYSDIDLYAKWQANTYNASLHANGGQTNKTYSILLNDFYEINNGFVVKEVKIDSGMYFNPYENCKSSCTIDNVTYYLKGWYLDSSYQTLLDEDYTIISDLNIFAKWEQSPSAYTVTNLNSSKEVEFHHYSDTSYLNYYRVVSDDGIDVSFDVKYKVDKIDNGSAYSSLSIYNITQGISILDITGQYLSKTGTITITARRGDIISFSLRRDNDMALNPYYKILNIRSEQLNVLTSNSDTIEKVVFNNNFEFPIYTKNGYDFIGWFDSNENAIDMSQKWDISNDIDLYAKWQLVKYTISYNLDGSINSLLNPNSYTIEDNFTLEIPTKEGYVFEGWYLDSNYNTAIESISYMSENLTLYAKFSANLYNLFLNDTDGYHEVKVEFISDGIIINSQYIGSSGHLTYIEPQLKDNYIFAGWYQEPTFINLFDFSANVSEHSKLYAKWISIEHSTQIIETNSSVLSNIEINGKDFTIYAFTAKTSGLITFTADGIIDSVGCLYDDAMNVLVSNDDIDNENINFSITYQVQAGKLYYLGIKANQTSVLGEINLNIIGFNNPICSGFGQTFKEQTISVRYDDYFELPIPVKNGYDFIGWFDSSDTQYISGIWNFKDNLYLYAKWKLNAD